MKRVLLTGANGFIGRSLAEHLRLAGYWVRGAVRNVRQNNLPFSETVSVGDIGWETNWESTVEGIDFVVHLAARVHVLNERASDPLILFRRVNVGGIKGLAEQSIKAGVQRLIYISSIGVHGDRTKDGAFTEASQISPSGPYACSKVEAEEILNDLANNSGFEHVIIRPPLVYGPDNPGNFLRLLRWVDRGLPLPLASVENQRSFVGINNLVDFIACCMEHPNAVGETFLVSDRDEISTPNLIKRISNYMGKQPRLFPCPVMVLKALGRVAGVGASVGRLTESLCVDIDKSHKLLEWSPPSTLDEGLRLTVEWYRKNARGK